MKRIVGFLGVALLLLFAWTGITGFVDQWSQATDPGRLIQTVFQLVYGCGAALCVVTIVWAKRWEPIGRASWIGGGTIAGGLAPTVWGGAPLWTSALSLLASLGLTLGVVWMVRRGWPLTARAG